MTNSVAVTIGGKRFRYWTNIQFSRSIDNIDTVELSAPFDPNVKEQRETFRPFSYQPFGMTIDDNPVFTGTLIPCAPEVDPESTTVSIGAYSLPGVLGDSPAPASSLPLEFKGQNLHEIAGTLASLFGVEIVAEVSPGPIFKKVILESDAKILPWLADLAKQRGQIINNDGIGRLRFWTALDSLSMGEPVASLEQGAPPVVSIKPKFNYTDYYSEITGIQPVKVRAKKSNKYTVKNTLLSDVFRPYVFRVDQSVDADLETAVRGKLGRMFANMVQYTVTVVTWRDFNGSLWEPNTPVQVYYPGAMIYRPYTFVIKEVTFDITPDSETATLELMLPGSFTANEPGGMPWDELL